MADAAVEWVIVRKYCKALWVATGYKKSAIYMQSIYNNNNYNNNNNYYYYYY